jgi:pre-mRNA-processing factor SLU7
VEKRVRTAGGGSTGSVRNLRIREDTAKYLLNLDTNSAYYDPKSRSMREDPNPNKDPAQKTFYGDNFVRQSGEVGGFRDLNVFSITTHERGQDVHMQVGGTWWIVSRRGGRLVG